MTDRPSSDPSFDAEIRAFIDRAPRSLTYSQLAEECQNRFGPERAWSRDEIARYWLLRDPRKLGNPFKIQSDPELRAFVDDRLGRHPVPDILKECRARFGAYRAPSRSALYRYWNWLRIKGP